MEVLGLIGFNAKKLIAMSKPPVSFCQYLSVFVSLHIAATRLVNQNPKTLDAICG